MKQLIKELAELLRELWARFKFWSNGDKHCFHCCLWCKYFDDCKAETESESAEKLENEIDSQQDLSQITQSGIFVVTRKEHEIMHFGEQIEIHKATEQAISKRMSLLKPYRQYERIKDMSLDEMAGFFDDIIAHCANDDCEGCPFNGFCYSTTKQWLESEVKKTDEN